MDLDVQQFASALRDALRKDLNNYTDDLASNNCRTIEDYRFICGRLQGLADAETHLKSLAKKVEENDDA